MIGKQLEWTKSASTDYESAHSMTLLIQNGMEVRCAF